MASTIASLGNAITGGNQVKSSNLAQGATQAYLDVNTPNLSPLDLEDLVNQGKITPEQAQAYTQGPSALNGISTDPAYQQAQMDALNSLKGISDSGGVTAGDQANLSQIASNEGAQQKGARDAILQNAAARGVGGSGAELLAQLQNQQSSATRQNQQDLGVAGQAQARALQALQSAGQLGSQLQTNQFNQQAEVGKANDAINQFNAQNQQQTGMYNTQAANAAQAQNLANSQNIANQNTAIHNQQTQYNTANLPQTDYDNQFKKAQGISNSFLGQASNATQAGNQDAQITGAGLQAVGQLGGALVKKIPIGAAVDAGTDAAATSDKNKKENIEPFDASKFLDSLTSYKYNYKDPKEEGAGKFAGPMAQDLEKTPEGASLVSDSPQGKKVDYGKGFGTILAALTDVHSRVKNLEGKK